MAANSAVSPDDQVSPGHNPLLYQLLSQRIILFVILYYISEAFALFSLCLHVFPIPRRSALPSFPCFLQQTFQTIHHSNATIKKTHNNKGIKNQKAKLRSYFLLFSGSLSVSYANFTATNRSYPSPPSLYYPPPRPLRGSYRDAVAARVVCRPVGCLSRRRVDPRPAPRTSLDSPLPSTPTQRRPAGPEGPLPLEVAVERVAIPGRPGRPRVHRRTRRGTPRRGTRRRSPRGIPRGIPRGSL